MLLIRLLAKLHRQNPSALVGNLLTPGDWKSRLHRQNPPSRVWCKR